MLSSAHFGGSVKLSGRAIFSRYLRSSFDPAPPLKLFEKSNPGDYHLYPPIEDGYLFGTPNDFLIVDANLMPLQLGLLRF